MSKIGSMTVFALVAGVLLAWRRVGRDPDEVQGPASTRVPGRDALGAPDLHRATLESEPDLLDASLDLTLPASDPIGAQAATRGGRQFATTSNPTDWRLHPGSLASSPAAPEPARPSTLQVET